MNKRWMIYGAYGYSGELMVREAVKQGLKPILAGRNAEKLTPLASKYDLEMKSFPLDDAAFLRDMLDDIGLVIHCAGPFSATAKPMIEACLQSRKHYFDITGEIDVFEYAHSAAVNRQAEENGIVICPGVGFDVVPTDCMAMTLAANLHNATHLTLGFASQSRFSPGTAKTMVEGLGQGVRHRRNGVIQACPLTTRHIDFGNGQKQLAMGLAWGDVSTAFYTTGIPNIDVFIAAPAKTVRQAKMSRFIRPFLSLGFVQNRMKRKIEASIKGPSDAQRDKYPTYVWGEAVNEHGAAIQGFLQTPNGYTFTALAPVAIVKHWIEHGFDQVGSRTPARLMGRSFVSSLPGCSEFRIDRAN